MRSVSQRAAASEFGFDFAPGPESAGAAGTGHHCPAGKQ